MKEATLLQSVLLKGGTIVTEFDSERSYVVTECVGVLVLVLVCVSVDSNSLICCNRVLFCTYF